MKHGFPIFKKRSGNRSPLSASLRNSRPLNHCPCASPTTVVCAGLSGERAVHKND